VKNPRYPFAGNLFLSTTSCEYRYDIITVTSVIKPFMDTLSLKASRKEQCSVIRFL